jgi:hypothetical protein
MQKKVKNWMQTFTGPFHHLRQIPSLRQKSAEKLLEKLLYEKASVKMLVKLTTEHFFAFLLVMNFTNILRAAFLLTCIYQKRMQGQKS